MSTYGNSGISLSRWHACLRLDAGLLRSSAPRQEDGFRIGPFTIFGDGHGCELKSFGQESSKSVVIFDGYLFDRDELIRELGLDRYLAVNADIVAAAFERWGVDVFDRLDGCYLAAIWDGATRKLFLGHDAMGRHPVFYAIEAGTVWFASNILTLASNGQVPSTPNRLSLALNAVRYWPEAGQTFFERVRRVRPGHFIQITSGHLVSERKYWDHLPAADEPWLCDETVHEQFEETLTRAIGRCLALAPSGMMLSGGVDAVTIAALASKRLSEERLGPLTAVCATGRPLSHEEAMQSRLSAALGMPMVPSSTAEWTEGRNDVELSMEMTSELPCPTSVWWVGSYTRFYRRTAAQGFNVLLTGAGGDNWLGAADAHAADLMGRLQLIQLYRFLKADIGTSGSSLPRSLHRLLWKSGVQMHIDSLWALLAPKLKSQHHRQRWIENLPSWLCPDRELRQQLIEHLLNRRMPALTPAGTIPKSYYRHSLRPAASPSWHHENETAYHLETWCGLRLLSPYYDRRLVSFFNRISPGVLLDGDRYKGLLRPVVARHLPGFGLGTQRKAYVKEVQELDLQNLYHGVMREWERQDFKSLNRLGVIDGPATQREIRRIDGKRIDPMVRLFALMNAECWTHLHTAA